MYINVDAISLCVLCLNLAILWRLCSCLIFCGNVEFELHWFCYSLLDFQYYMRTGACKFGTSCKYHHPKQGGGSVIPVSLNYYGYPLRPVCIFTNWCLIFCVFCHNSLLVLKLSLLKTFPIVNRVKKSVHTILKQGSVNLVQHVNSITHSQPAYKWQHNHWLHKLHLCLLP